HRFGTSSRLPAAESALRPIQGSNQFVPRRNIPVRQVVHLFVDFLSVLVVQVRGFGFVGCRIVVFRHGRFRGFLRPPGLAAPTPAPAPARSLPWLLGGLLVGGFGRSLFGRIGRGFAVGGRGGLFGRFRRAASPAPFRRCGFFLWFLVRLFLRFRFCGGVAQVFRFLFNPRRIVPGTTILFPAPLPPP